MNKFAHMVKTAEVRGVMAYLVDSKMVKVASEEDFNTLVNVVSDNLEGDYDLNTVLSKTAEILTELTPDVKEEIEKKADLLPGAAIGAVRAARLSPEERATLRRRYGLKDDASLTARNTGRGALSGALGSIAGGGAAMASGNPRYIVPAGIATGVGSALLGTRKYSKGNV